MQLPLPTAHRYHQMDYSSITVMTVGDNMKNMEVGELTNNPGSSLSLYPKELEEAGCILPANKNEISSADHRVVARAQELVRQGYSNQFFIRTALKVCLSFMYLTSCITAHYGQLFDEKYCLSKSKIEQVRLFLQVLLIHFSNPVATDYLLFRTC